MQYHMDVGMMVEIVVAGVDVESLQWNVGQALAQIAFWDSSSCWKYSRSIWSRSASVRFRLNTNHHLHGLSKVETICCAVSRGILLVPENRGDCAWEISQVI